jgi:hypothetical protein
MARKIYGPVCRPAAPVSQAQVWVHRHRRGPWSVPIGCLYSAVAGGCLTGSLWLRCAPLCDRSAISLTTRSGRRRLQSSTRRYLPTSEYSQWRTSSRLLWPHPKLSNAAETRSRTRTLQHSTAANTRRRSCCGALLWSGHAGFARSATDTPNHRWLVRLATTRRFLRLQCSDAPVGLAHSQVPRQGPEASEPAAHALVGAVAAGREVQVL